MKKIIIGKTLAVAVIILFLGLAIQPSVAVQTDTEIKIEPKDYLFQTILDIANNLEIKNLLAKYDNVLFKVDIDKSVYRKILLRNPRLLFNTLFTKSSMSLEYLNECYNKGIEITNIIGDDESLEIIENAEVTDRKLFDEFNNIITKDEELSSRLATLKEMNNALNLDWGFPIFCSILNVLMIIPLILFGFGSSLEALGLWFRLIGFIGYVIVLITVPIVYAIINVGTIFDCNWWFIST